MAESAPAADPAEPLVQPAADAPKSEEMKADNAAKKKGMSTYFPAGENPPAPEFRKMGKHHWIHGDKMTCKLCLPCMGPCTKCCAFGLKCKTCECHPACACLKDCTCKKCMNCECHPACATNCVKCKECKAACNCSCGACMKCNCHPCFLDCKTKCCAVCDPCKLKCKAVCDPCKLKCKECCKICDPCKIKCKECSKCGCIPGCNLKCNLHGCIECMNCECHPSCASCKICVDCMNCECGPDCECKAVGCELCPGPLKTHCGNWHMSTDMYPKFLPAILYPCCCGKPAIQCCGGKDEVYEPETNNFRNPGVADPPTTYTMKCGSMFCPNPPLKKMIAKLKKKAEAADKKKKEKGDNKGGDNKKVEVAEKKSDDTPAGDAAANPDDQKMK